jgi:hypothetical protein
MSTLSPRIIVSLLQNRAAECRRWAQNFREAGFLPHTTASNDAEAMLMNLARELEAMIVDIQALDNPPKETKTHAR